MTFDLGGWVVDRRIPITLLAAIVLQSIAAIWWAASVSYRLDNQDKRIDGLIANNQVVQQERLINLQRLSRVEQAIYDIQKTLERIDTKLTKFTERQP